MKYIYCNDHFTFCQVIERLKHFFVIIWRKNGSILNIWHKISVSSFKMQKDQSRYYNNIIHTDHTEVCECVSVNRKSFCVEIWL